jgi:hypothetical protein
VPAIFPLIDLATILLFMVMFVLALTVKTWLHAIFQVVDKLVGWVPLVGNWVKAGENHVLSALNVLIVKSRGAMGACISGLRWSVREFETGVRDFADDVNARWDQLVNHALPNALTALHDDVAGAFTGVNSRIDVIAGRVADVGPSIRKAAADAETRAVNAASAYADTAAAAVHTFVVEHVRGVYKEVEADIAGTLHAAQAYTDDAVATLRHAEDAAVGAASSAATAALNAAKSDLTAGIGAVSGALASARAALETEIGGTAAAAVAEVEALARSVSDQIAAAEALAEQAALTALAAEAHTLGDAITDARAAAALALSAATATVEAELGAISRTAADDLHGAVGVLSDTIGNVEAHVGTIVAQLAATELAAAGELTDIYNLPADALRDLLDRLDLTKVASMGAGLVLVRGLVEALTREAGLDSAECRAKNKQICGTPGGEWGDLLAGAAFVTGALSLAELIVPARGAFHLLTEAIEAAT